ncbi:putative reverse transcriptase domain-containing protein [Tanacetum coccineum]|uniref:Reverse transcriptase domain-containing protein n=1 Tax=Tanacetum coccineum TaxID=301880 RepID=A0ABQ5IHU0_9ASTR
MSMTIQTSVKDRILAAQGEASKVENTPTEMLRCLDQQIEKNEDGGFYFMDRIWIPLVGEEDYKMERLARLYIDEIVARYGVPVSIISDSDGRFNSWFWQTLKKALGNTARYDYHSSIQYAPFEALYGRKCRPPVLWAEIGESWLIGLELVQETTDKVVLIKERLKRVMLIIGKEKLSPRYVGPFQILERIGSVAYHLRLPQELSNKTLRYVEDCIDYGSWKLEVENIMDPNLKRDVTIIVSEPGYALLVDTRGYTPKYSGSAFEAGCSEQLMHGYLVSLLGLNDIIIDAKNWIAHIKKIFEVLGCADEFKARLASYKLEGDTLNWWKAFKQAKGGKTYVATLSWKDFRDIFFLQYFPRSEQQKYEREYHTIRQRDGETSGKFMKRFLMLAGFVVEGMYTPKLGSQRK